MREFFLKRFVTRIGTNVGFPVWLPRCSGNTISSPPAGMFRSIQLMFFVVASLALFGCAMQEVLHTEPGVDVTGLRPGIDRAEVEALVGAPRSQWTTTAGVSYSIYKYYAGKEASMEGAAVVGFFEITTLGLWEAMRAYNPTAFDFSDEGKRYAFLAVSYDSHNKVIGVFPNIHEFAALPADGRTQASPGVSGERSDR
jgi:hypothetical protein